MITNRKVDSSTFKISLQVLNLPRSGACPAVAHHHFTNQSLNQSIGEEILGMYLSFLVDLMITGWILRKNHLREKSRNPRHACSLLIDLTKLTQEKSIIPSH